jgi:hypothetical protein
LAKSNIGDPLATAQFVVKTHFAQDWRNFTVEVGISVNDHRESVEVPDIVSDGNEGTAGELENLIHLTISFLTGLGEILDREDSISRLFGKVKQYRAD